MRPPPAGARAAAEGGEPPARAARLLVVTGRPATGKTTLARALARRWSAPLLAKDSIKEPLLDVLGAADAAASRRLSDASFAVLFALARELIAAGASLLLEGNFRPGEHAAPLRELIESSVRRGAPGDGHLAPIAAQEIAHGEGGLICAQLLCRTDESERIRRLAARATDATRHPGHRDAEQARKAAAAVRPSADAIATSDALVRLDPRVRSDEHGADPAEEYLNVPGERFCFTGACASEWPQILERLDRWWLAGQSRLVPTR